MARPLRIEFPGALYHVTSRGNARQRVFHDDEDRETFLATLAWVVERFKWRCHAYCLWVFRRSPLLHTTSAGGQGHDELYVDLDSTAGNG